MAGMAMMALAVGVISGAGAIVFRGLIALVHNALFLGRFSVVYNANVHTPESPWGAGVIVVPMLGALGVAYLVKNFAPEARGHGVPEVMEAIYYARARIRPVVAAIKALASGISIGSGGSVGREGPIAQIGSAFGSTLGQIVPMPAHQRATLIAAGAGGGIAATFNTPLGGVAFAVELMLPATSAVTVLPVAIACVTSTYISRLVLGLEPAFSVPVLPIDEVHMLSPAAFLLFVVLGTLLGLVATLFIHSIYWFEDRFDAIKGNYYTRHLLGMSLVGVTMYSLMRFSGHYYVQGVGYAAIEDVLEGALAAPLFLLLLFALKLWATSLTLGSGASGGIFSPSLFMGATLGGCFGVLVASVFPDLRIGAPAFAIIGMAGMVAGATGAVITSITMLYEMTRDYNVILPVILTVGFAYGVRKRILAASIYTAKALRRGRFVPEGLEAALDSGRTADRLMTDAFAVLPVETGRGRLGSPPDEGQQVVVLEEEGRVKGVMSARPREAADAAASDPASVRLGEASYIFVGERANMRRVLADLLEHGAEVALVTGVPGSEAASDILGVITTVQLGGVARADGEVIA